MKTMTLDQAKTHLDDLLARAAAGEEVVIVRDDGSIFTLVPVLPRANGSGKNGDHGPRRVKHGSSRGRFWMAPDFDDIPKGFEPYLGDDSTDEGNHPDSSIDDEVADLPENSRGSYGIVRGQIWMAPDFDDIPEGFEPYLGDSDDY